MYYLTIAAFYEGSLGSSSLVTVWLLSIYSEYDKTLL